MQSNEPANYNVKSDVAESVAGTIGEGTGGLMDQIGDLLVIAEKQN